ncbi:ATP-binding protein [Haloarcula sediminis]|uniref:ATP-binding protein n=1 Tax=Haloarcula sediminis TaxID=3111777 RepID=UPI002D76D712|nr:ATP-binding protein [Haloarcula sp. CK38]
MSGDLRSDLLEGFAAQFLMAESPGSVSDILEDLEEQCDLDWRALGQEPNNYGTVQTQASSPMPCFVELKANADDAVLIRGFEENAPAGAEPDEYPTMASAAEAFSPDDGEIEILADGTTPTDGNVLNLTIRDKGCGQPPEKFEDTFLGLHTPGVIKQKYSFTQGQYGMGGTGVLQFCGDRHKGCYKFVASASHQDPGNWSWSLIRQNRDANQYEYCLVDRKIPRFDGEFGQSLVDTVPGAESGDYGQEFGSFVKVYDYQMDVSRADISGQEGFLYKFERYVVDSPLSVTMTETRDYSTSVTQNTTRGFLPTLNESRNQKLLKGTETLTYDFTDVGSEILGERDIDVFLFKHEDEIDDEESTSRSTDRFLQKTSSHTDMTGRTGIHEKHAVMFTVNGQTHGDQGLGFLKNQCGYSKVAEDTVVIVRFDDFANPDMSDLFKPTRDRLQDGKEETRCLKQGLKDALKQSDMLTDEEDRRRAKRGTDDAEFDTDSFENFVKDNPEFASYVNSGRKISGPRLHPQTNTSGEGDGPSQGTGEGDGKDIESENSDPWKIPTFLTGIEEYQPDNDHVLWDESDSGMMQIEVPVNRRKKVRFATDAQDDYLNRDTLSGELTASHSDLVRVTELHDSVLTLTVEPPEGASSGDSRMMTISMTRPTLTAELVTDLDYSRIAGAETEILESEDVVLECYRALCPDTIDIADTKSVDTAPLYGHVEIVFTDEEEAEDPPTPSSSGGGSDSGGGDGDGDAGTDESSGGMAVPNILTVYQKHWDFDPDAEDFDPGELDIDEDEVDSGLAREFDENVIMRMDESLDGTISGLTLTINMDAAPLRSFIVNRNVKETYKEYVEDHYKNSIVFMTISQYRELKDKREEEFTEKEIGVTGIIENSAL